VGTWASRTSWRTAQGRGSTGQEISDTGNMLLYAETLVVGGVEEFPGPGVEAENSLQVLCSGCDRNTMRHVWTLVSQQLWKRQGSNG
jgi:hypothetical protein